MAKQIRFGIVGCGVIAPWHAQAINNSDKCSLVAVCDTELPKAEEFAAKHGAARVYADITELVSDPEIDAICVCVPSGLHAELGVIAANHKKHVLVEKPIDISLSSIDYLVQEADRNNVKLGCIFQRRTQPLWQAVKKVVDGGGLGKLLLADAYLKYYRSQEYYNSAGWRGTWALDGGGALMNQGVHCVDLLLWIAGDPLSVYAHAEHLVRDIEVEDTAVGILRFRNGALGVVEGTTSVWSGFDHRLEFHGDKGNIAIEGARIVRWDTDGADGFSLEEMFGDDDQIQQVQNEVGPEGHLAQIEDFACSILEDRPPLVEGQQARRAVELILGIYQSGKTGKPVGFPLQA